MRIALYDHTPYTSKLWQKQPWDPPPKKNRRTRSRAHSCPARRAGPQCRAHSEGHRRGNTRAPRTGEQVQHHACTDPPHINTPHAAQRAREEKDAQAREHMPSLRINRAQRAEMHTWTVAPVKIIAEVAVPMRMAECLTPAYKHTASPLLLSPHSGMWGGACEVVHTMRVPVHACVRACVRGSEGS